MNEEAICDFCLRPMKIEDVVEWGDEYVIYVHPHCAENLECAARRIKQRAEEVIAQLFSPSD